MELSGLLIRRDHQAGIAQLLNNAVRSASLRRYFSMPRMGTPSRNSGMRRLVLERVRDQIEQRLVIDVGAVVVLLRLVREREQREPLDPLSFFDRRQVVLL